MAMTHEEKHSMDGATTTTAPPEEEDEAGEATATRYYERKQLGKRPASMEFPADLHARVKEQARREDRSMAAILRQAAREYCDNMDRRLGQNRAG